MPVRCSQSDSHAAHRGVKIRFGGIFAVGRTWPSACWLLAIFWTMGGGWQEPVAAQNKTPAQKPPVPNSGPMPPSPAGPKAPAQPGTAATTADAEAERLLAEKERKLGATFPGQDPAFLVLPRPAYRSTVAADLSTAEVQQMNDRALAYLARLQDPDGGWSDTQFAANTGVTALACLAFMAEGSQPRVGKYGRNLDRGLEFLLNNVQSNGVISGKGSNPLGPGYEHAYATLALLMSYGDMPWRPQARDVISRSLQVLLRSQKLDGGWRYQMSRDGLSDLSITANVLWVLRSAKKAGFTVPKESIDKGVTYIEQCANPDGTFRYLAGGLHAEPSLGGTGMIALANHGRLDHPLVAPARDRIAYDYRRYTIDDLRQRRYCLFGVLYASLAMYPCGDEYFVPWFQKTVQLLAAMQQKDGEFLDEHGNRVYTTAMAALVLQAPKGYLPLYER